MNTELEPKNTNSQAAAAQIRTAQTALRAGNHAEAERIFRTVLSEIPDSMAAAAGLIKIFEARGERKEAEEILRSVIVVSPTHANILAAARQWEAWEASPRADAKTLRVALTGTGTLNSLGAHLRVAAAQIGLQTALYVGDFNQWAQDLLPPKSALYEFAPELIVILIDTGALFPKALGDLGITADELAAERQAGLTQIRELLMCAHRSAPAATVLLHTFAVPDYSPYGILDLKTELGQRERVQAINTALIDLVRRDFPKVALFDQERVEARYGKERTRDDRLWYMASVPFSESFLPVMAAEYLRTIRPLKGLVRKCIVLDLDNTLWGGVIGEDGLAQIKIGGTAAPGNAFSDFQRALQALQRRGILLALCSKNNPDDAWEVFDHHPDMILKRSDFAAVRVNWQDKATNIAAIAKELNIGLDSLVFLDDNPMERALVRQQTPDVLTVEMPRDPAYYTRTLLNLDVFETLALTTEDQNRGRLYLEQQERKSFEETLTSTSTGDITAYLRGLEIVLSIDPATPFTLPRIAQLINKTNQFNVTTRRYTEAQVQALMDAPQDWNVISAIVSDRFGDSGLTGVALVKKLDHVWEIDSFLLSCRVLGRGIEDALLTYIAQQARHAGARVLRGVFIPTAKNAPAENFFRDQGFINASDGLELENSIYWELPLESDGAARDYPNWLTIKIAKE